MDLSLAVKISHKLQERRGQHFMWLCVTNKGANKINQMSLSNQDISEEQQLWGYEGDANASAGRMFLKPGLWIRLTRNLDKTRGFVNGALAQVVHVLASNAIGVTVCTAKLSTGAMVVVHPICVGGKCFLPCTYGYATTIRRSQGSSLHLGALYFDHCYPPDRGYGYVGASRFRTLGGLYLYGKIRRTDWVPVGLKRPDWEMRRSSASISSDSGHDSGYDSDSDSGAFSSASRQSRNSYSPMGQDYNMTTSDYKNILPIVIKVRQSRRHI